jgi:iron-sulfur cluster assembly accessory protein
MVQITDKAAVEFKTLLKKEGKEDHGVKLFVAGFGCSGPQYGLSLEEKPEDGETVYESNDVKIYLTKEAAEALEGVEIDYIKSEHGEGFVINNPKANGCGPTCGGCG